ncbi:MAG TPA: hypothetical protein VFK05_37775 [Polyangiaceae bacterium]|nr:hypothetical protein [Polyangiaceae bacterium]
MITIARGALLLAALSASFACSSGEAPVDIGDGRTGEKLEDYEGRWEGYVEANNFADGSDKVRLTLDAAGQGTLVLGNDHEYPPASDPNVLYPPGVTLNTFGDLLPGYPYPTLLPKVDSDRIRFSINHYVVESDWCALQTPYEFFPGDYRCAPNGSTSGDPAGDCTTTDGVVTVTMSCKRWDVCSKGACECDAQRCWESGRAGSPMFDAALDDSGKSLVGTILVPRSTTVRLKRVSSN